MNMKSTVKRTWLAPLGLCAALAAGLVVVALIATVGGRFDATSPRCTKMSMESGVVPRRRNGVMKMLNTSSANVRPMAIAASFFPFGEPGVVSSNWLF